MRRQIFLVLTLVVVFSVMVMAAPKPRGDPCPIKVDTNVVMYGDTGFGGVGDLSKTWMVNFLNWWESYDSSINYVILDDNDIESDCDFSNYPNLKLYIQPGGNAYYQQNSLGSAGKANIKDFILNDDGAYFGACAGFYYAAGDYYWQGEYYNWGDLLGLYPATVEGSITDIADYDVNPGYALTSVDNGFEMIYYGGPTQGWRDTSLPLPSGAEQLLGLNAVGGLPAAIKYNKMLLTTVHSDLYEGVGISGLTTSQRIENYKWLANNLNGVAGTSFVVPPYAEPPVPKQCGDGIDNDGDGFVDLADVGCSSALDDVEDGNLDGWSLASVENNWYVGTSNPYQGLKYAEAKPMNTNEPASILEISVSTVGYGGVTVNYYRRLVGLDSADEFKARWFDGISWHVLEQTGSSSANDAGYVLKSFDLPFGAGDNSAFKIRFECTAGATSEFCRVDNVEIIGQ